MLSFVSRGVLLLLVPEGSWNSVCLREILYDRMFFLPLRKTRQKRLYIHYDRSCPNVAAMGMSTCVYLQLFEALLV